MTQRLEIRTIVGLLIWIGLFSGGLLLAKKTWNRSPTAMTQLGQFVGKQRFSVQINFDEQQIVRVGDPVFLAGNHTYSPVGFVSRAGVSGSKTKLAVYANTAEITFYGCAPTMSDRDFLTYHAAGDDTAWVLKTMLPNSKREEISQLILKAYAQNKAEIVETMRPIVAESLQSAGQIIKEDIAAAFARREENIQAIGKKYQSELIEQELVPLIQNEIWPIIRAESEPLFSQIGQEIWQEVSVLRFGWRYLYDRSPLPDQNLAGREFERFMEQKALPILEAHLNEFLELQQLIVEKVSQNEKVRQTVMSSLKTVATDPEIQQIVNEVFQEVFVNNDRLKEAIERHWNSPQARAAIERTNQRIEPTITEIGVALFGSPREQITPEFARVLRHRILHKDDRWLTLHAGVVDGDRNRNSQPDQPVRWPKPDTMEVRIANPAGQIPYAPSRERN